MDVLVNMKGNKEWFGIMKKEIGNFLRNKKGNEVWFGDMKRVN